MATRTTNKQDAINALIKVFPNILKTESWLSESGMYNFPKILEESMELIRKYRL